MRGTSRAGCLGVKVRYFNFRRFKGFRSHGESSLSDLMAGGAFICEARFIPFRCSAIWRQLIRTLMFPCQSKLSTVIADKPARFRTPRTASWKCSESKSSGLPGAQRRRFTHVTGKPSEVPASPGRYTRASLEKYCPVPW